MKMSWRDGERWGKGRKVDRNGKRRCDMKGVVGSRKRLSITTKMEKTYKRWKWQLYRWTMTNVEKLDVIPRKNMEKRVKVKCEVVNIYVMGKNYHRNGRRKYVMRTRKQERIICQLNWCVKYNLAHKHEISQTGRRRLDVCSTYILSLPSDAEMTKMWNAIENYVTQVRDDRPMWSKKYVSEKTTYKCGRFSGWVVWVEVRDVEAPIFSKRNEKRKTCDR